MAFQLHRDCWAFKFKFSCSQSDKLSHSSAYENGKGRIHNVLFGSGHYKDGLSQAIKEHIEQDSDFSLTHHHSCASKYTLKKAYKRQHVESPSVPAIEEPSQKRARRSELPEFNIKTDCLDCAKYCDSKKIFF